MGLYRALYICNWIYRAHTEPWYRHHYLVYVCGVLQTLLYLDFFYQYCKALGFEKKNENANEDERPSSEEDADHGNKLIFEHEMTARRRGVAEAVGSASTAPLLVPSSLNDETVSDGQQDNRDDMKV